MSTTVNLGFEMKSLYIIRGVSGSGKTTLAEQLCQLPDSEMIAMDDYFYDQQGNYNFDGSKLKTAIDDFDRRLGVLFNQDKTNIIIHNTSTGLYEFERHIDLANKHGYQVFSLINENRHGNSSVHNVPEKSLVRQESKLRNNIKLR